MNAKRSEYSKYKLRVRRSFSGLGLFAEEVIPRYATIVEYVGRRVPANEGDQLKSRYVFSVNSRWDIDGSPRWNIARYINHSCRPNCVARERRGRIFIVAKRKIKPDEELSYDYGKQYFDEYIGHGSCRCKRCVL